MDSQAKVFIVFIHITPAAVFLRCFWQLRKEFFFCEEICWIILALVVHPDFLVY